jgi:hypothetical protein
MRKQDMAQLTPGTRVHHARYGACTVQDVLTWAVVIRPSTAQGQAQHAADSHTTIQDHLEASPRRLMLIP